MGWFSRKKEGNSTGKAKGGTPPGGILSHKEEIPKLVIERLNHTNEGMVAVGVNGLLANEKYPPNDVCEHLIRLLQRDGRETVVEAASKALVEALKRVWKADTTILMIKQGLFAKNEKNAGLFIKILESRGQKKEIIKCAIEMLAKFNESDVKPETLDKMEVTLFEKCMDAEGQECIKNLIKHRFGKNRDGRPKIMMEEGAEHGDETVAIETETESRRNAEIGPDGVPTAAMDVLAEWIGMLQHKDDKKRRIAANILVGMAEKSTDRGTVGKIKNALYGCGSEFWEQHRKVLSKLDSMPLGDRGVRDRPTLPPTRLPNSNGNGNRNGSGPVKLKR